MTTDTELHDDLDGQDPTLMSEFFLFLREEKKWWLAPLAVTLTGVSAAIVFAESSAIAPFIYTIF